MRSNAADQLGIVDLDAIDPDTLVVAEEMRRGEHPGRRAGGTQQRLQVRDGRSLAVGARQR